ncbi:MAG: hypothetical protein R3D70_05750 [Rhizobiaceae bacterium]
MPRFKGLDFSKIMRKLVDEAIEDAPRNFDGGQEFLPDGMLQNLATHDFTKEILESASFSVMTSDLRTWMAIHRHHNALVDRIAAGRPTKIGIVYKYLGNAQIYVHEETRNALAALQAGVAMAQETRAWSYPIDAELIRIDLGNRNTPPVLCVVTETIFACPLTLFDWQTSFGYIFRQNGRGREVHRVAYEHLKLIQGVRTPFQ